MELGKAIVLIVLVFIVLVGFASCDAMFAHAATPHAEVNR